MTKRESPSSTATREISSSSIREQQKNGSSAFQQVSKGYNFPTMAKNSSTGPIGKYSLSSPENGTYSLCAKRMIVSISEDFQVQYTMFNGQKTTSMSSSSPEMPLRQSSSTIEEVATLSPSSIFPLSRFNSQVSDQRMSFSFLFHIRNRTQQHCLPLLSRNQPVSLDLDNSYV